jgi:RHS repeat-associated protein
MRVTNMVDGSGSETYNYGLMGRISQLTKTIGTTSYVLGYNYNAGGELTQITYPSGHVVQQSYDAVGRLCEVAPQTSGCGAASNPYSTRYLWNGGGQLVGVAYGNGVVGNFSYNPNSSQLAALAYGKGTQTYFSLNYYYQLDSTNCKSATVGNNGQIQCIIDNVDSGRTVAYSYDGLSRLNAAVTNGSTNFAKWGLSWSYDRYGNRLNQTLTAGSGPQNSMSFANPGGAQTNQPDGMCFDSAGNLLSETITPCPSPTFSYDAENRLTGYLPSGASYTYDGHGQRVKKISGGITTVYIYSNGQDIAEYDNGASLTSPSREFTYSGNDLLTTISGNKTTYHHKDHLSVRLQTDGTSGSPTYGQVISQQATFPYGESWYSTGTASPDKLVFTSYQRDSESGLDYALARFYESRLGRFCSADPVSGTPDDPQSWNRYAYVRNDPINKTDPTGKFWGLLIELIASIIESALSALSSLFTSLGLSGLGQLGQVALTLEPQVIEVTAEAVAIPTTAAVLTGTVGASEAATGAATGTAAQPQSLNQRLRNDLKKPDCAALYGGPDRANQILNHFKGIVDVDTPNAGGGNWFNAAKKALDAHFAWARTPALPDWTGYDFQTYVGPDYMGFTPSTKETIILHEFLHVSRGSSWLATAFVDLKMANVPGMAGDRLATAYEINKACGTELPPGY